MVFADPAQNLSAVIAHERPDYLSLVPTQLWRLLQQPECLPALRAARGILIGGAAVPDSLLERASQLELPLHVSYGATEMSSHICTTTAGATRSELLTAGRLLPWRELKLAPDGEIQLRGPTRFSGYYHQGQLEQPFDAEGWFNSGDLGCWTPEGWLRVLGRKDYRFICGGENVQPEQIEQALLRLPGVIQAVVVPLADPEYGQRPVAFVESLDFNPSHLRVALREQLPGYLIPRQFLAWPAESGFGLKFNRRQLQQWAAAQLNT